MTFRNRRAAAQTLAYLCATAALAACSPDSLEAGNPNTAPPISSSSAPQTQPGSATSASSAPSTPPERPEPAVGLTLAAADAFVRYYIQLLNYTSATGDTQPLLSASDDGCRQCKVYADYVRRVNAANGGLSGDYLERITDIPDLFRGKSGRLGGYASVTIGGYTTKESPSAKPVTSTAQSYKREFTLSPQQKMWVMYEMKLVEQ